MATEETNRILMDIHKQVGRIEGTLDGVKELGEKTHRQATKTNGRVTQLENDVQSIRKNHVSVNTSGTVKVKNATINKYVDKALLVGAVAGAFIIGLLDTLT